MNSQQSSRRSRVWRKTLLYLGCFAVVGFLAAVGWAAYDWATKHTAQAYLRVAARERHLVFPAVGDTAASEFEIFKNTQVQLLKSPFVLTAALREPEVRKLKVDERHYDPVGWLADQIRADFPGKAEIMEVRLTSKDPKEAATLVNAVVNAYLTEVVNAVRKERENHLNQLENLYSKKEIDVRQQRAVLKKLAEEFGASDPKALSIRQQLALEQYAQAQREFYKLRFDFRQTQRELKVREATPEALKDLKISEADLDNAARSDPVTTQVLFPMLAHLKQQLLEVQVTGAKPSESAEYAARLQRGVQDIEQQLAQRREELREKLREEKAAAVKAEIQRLQAQLAVTGEMEQEAAKEVEKKKVEAEKVISSSIELEMERTRLEQLDQMLRDIAKERDQLKVEINAAPRVNLIQPAEVPRGKE